MKKTSIFRTILTYVFLIALAVFAISTLSSTVTKDMTYTELMQKIEEQKVTSVTLDNTRQSAEVIIKDEEKFLVYTLEV